MSTLPLFPDMPDPHDARPRVRADCEAGSRPCPWYSCRYHLGIDVTPAGSVIVRIPVEMLDRVPHTCALDVAAEGPHSLAEIGRLTGRLRTDGTWSPLAAERVRNVEDEGLLSLRVMLERMGAAGDWIDGASELLAELDEADTDTTTDDDSPATDAQSWGLWRGDNDVHG